MTRISEKSRVTSSKIRAQGFQPPKNDAFRLSFPSPIPDSSSGQKTKKHAREGGRFEQLSEGVHYHVEMDSPFAGSKHEFCVFRDGFLLVSGDIYFDTADTVFASFPDMLRIYVAISSDGESVFANGESLSLRGPISALIIEPENCLDSIVTSAGHNKFVCIFLHRNALKDLYAERECELQTDLLAFAQGKLRKVVARAIPLTPYLLRCMEDVHSCQLRGQRRRLYMQSKAIEIVCLAFESFEHDDSSFSNKSKKLAINGVLKAQRLVSDNFTSPPSLNDLAREVGMSRTALCTGFRRILGQSVFDYIEELRMQHALMLLGDRANTVTQVAHAVGYNHSSSFSVAIHRRFGTTPSKLRRRADSSRSDA